MRFIISLSFLLLSFIFVDGQTGCNPVDIAVVVDSHLHIAYLYNVKSFIMNSVSDFAGVSGYAKFSLAVYHGRTSSVISDFRPMSNLAAMVDSLTWTWQETAMDSSLSLGYGADLFSEAHGSTASSDKILVLVTSSHHTPSATLTQLLIQRNLKTYVAMVASTLPKFFFQNINFVGVGNLDGLGSNYALKKALADNICATASTVSSPIGTNPCSPNPCLLSCECVPSCKHQSGYYCVSREDGYVGKTCNIPAPTVTCEKHVITITVPSGFVNEYYGRDTTGSYIAMAQTYTNYGTDSYCKATTTSNGRFTLSLPLPFNGCGTSKFLAKDASMRFQNTIWLDVDGSSFTIPVPIVGVTCWYNSSYSVLDSLRPVVDEVQITESDESKFGSTNVELCKIASTCPSACPALFTVNEGAVYTISELINLRLSIINIGDSVVETTNNEFVAIVDDLYISCSSNPGSPTLQLLTGGCEVGHLNARINVAGVGLSVCISFKVPRVKCGGTYSNTFYIHATMEMIHKSNLQRCPNNRGYVSTSGRTKRSLEPHNSTVSQHSIGPIYVLLDVADGKSRSNLFPDSDPRSVVLAKELENFEPPSTESGPVVQNNGLSPMVLVAAAALGCLVLLLLVFVSVFFLRRRDVIEK